MDPRAAVAIILACGVLLILMSGTPWVYVFTDTVPEGVQGEAAMGFWKDIMLVIIGALSGYISGKGNDQ